MRRRFFADQFDDATAVMRGENAHRLARVLRVEAGQQYELAGGPGVFLATVTAVSAREVRFRLDQALPAGEPARLTAAVALFKFDRFEWMLEKATELDLARLIPLITRRTDPKLTAAAAKRRERWQRLARAASEQSRRGDLPVLEPAQRYEVWLAQARPGWMLWEGECAPLRPASVAAPLLFGPEGGWTEAEVESARAAGWRTASLGPRILRCETAVLAALAIVGCGG